MNQVVRRYLPVFLYLTLLAVIGVPGCYGQAVAVAAVQGQVLDASGSAVPGAQIKMT